MAQVACQLTPLPIYGNRKQYGSCAQLVERLAGLASTATSQKQPSLFFDVNKEQVVNKYADLVQQFSVVASTSPVPIVFHRRSELCVGYHCPVMNRSRGLRLREYLSSDMAIAPISLITPGSTEEACAIRIAVGTCVQAMLLVSQQQQQLARLPNALYVETPSVTNGAVEWVLPTPGASMSDFNASVTPCLTVVVNPDTLQSEDLLFLALQPRVFWLRFFSTADSTPPKLLIVVQPEPDALYNPTVQQQVVFMHVRQWLLSLQKVLGCDQSQITPAGEPLWITRLHVLLSSDVELVRHCMQTPNQDPLGVIAAPSSVTNTLARHSPTSIGSYYEMIMSDAPQAPQETNEPQHIPAKPRAAKRRLTKTGPQEQKKQACKRPKCDTQLIHA